MIKNWIDWMKVIGMFTIIWGHCFPVLFSDFLYTFNVPLFFFISGYLSKYESEKTVFRKKIVQRLVIPYLILAPLKACPHFFNEDAPWSLLAIITGFHSLNGVAGCGKLWFVYTLIIIKLVVQYTSYTRDTRLILFLSSLAGGVVCQYYLKESESWAVTNTFLALPWFLLGYEYKYLQWDTKLTEFFRRKSIWFKYLFTLSLLILVYVVSLFNGRVSMYAAGYGHHILLFMLGGCLGILGIRMISELLSRYSGRVLRLISIGTVVILCYHQDVNHPLLKIVRQEWSPLLLDTATFICSLITLLSFVPIIYIISHYLPFIIGNRKTRK